MRRDVTATVGIGALVMFIALIIVAALIAGSLIMTMEKTFKDQRKTGYKTNNPGSIIVESIFLHRFQPCWATTFVTDDPDCSSAPAGNQQPWGHHQLLMYFHLGVGSGPTPTSDIYYLVQCTNEENTDLDNDGFADNRGVTAPVFSSNFTFTNQFNNGRATGVASSPLENGQTLPQANDIPVTTLNFGESYRIKIDMFDNQNNNGVNEDRFGCRISLDYITTLFLIVEGGRTTSKELVFNNYNSGELIV